jgi:Na+-driven multidrug efflux pump
MTLRLLALVSIALSATIFVARFRIGGYSTNPEIVDLAASMLMWVAAYHPTAPGR